ncbi:DoxX family protein [Paenibacillus sp. KQZ6P-2]|uniref:DoxX family protein n=1 Tax=Paenibacillus mangrovi TaxID=2931978 RepID=A0A9X1WZ19_9BACL|nr:DoxX family protein [Paenibacillus mangrovi]MCJ8014809.1 DoxX family protein [Paenibacillus mangrovi]
MKLVPDPWWLSALLAAVLLFDAIVSIKPPAFIRNCLNGVNFPHDWWWTLIVIKLAATAGLVAGIWIPGVALAANVAVILYFLSASYAHIRARFLKQEFWMNCLGLLALSIIVLVFGFLI